MDVDYDTYAEGEAELGWLNCQAQLRSLGHTSFSLDELLVQLVSGVRDALARLGGETAHVKVLAQADHQSGIANLVGSGADVELSLPSGAMTRDAVLTVNARVAIAPQQLADVVSGVIEIVARRSGLHWSITGMQRFRPGRPIPTHRMVAET
jgi:hypothetical protein